MKIIYVYLLVYEIKNDFIKEKLKVILKTIENVFIINIRKKVKIRNLKLII